METHCTAYAKPVNGILFYFVKQFQTFPDLPGVPPVLESYGMHTDFKKACRIAQVYDKALQMELLKEMQNDGASAKELPLYPAAAEIYSLRKRQASFPGILRLIGLG